MPYKSKAQVRYMHMKHPKIARRWDETYGVDKDLPGHYYFSRESTQSRLTKAKMKAMAKHRKRKGTTR